MLGLTPNEAEVQQDTVRGDAGDGIWGWGEECVEW